MSCSKCSPEYELVFGICKASNCDKINDRFECDTCSQGYKLNNSKFCEKIIDPCQTYSSAGICISCTKGYVLQRNNCFI